MNLYDVIDAAGLDPAEFETVAHAEPVARPNQDDLPGLIMGRYRGHNAAIRCWPRVVDSAGHVSAWDALAYTSQHPALASQQMTAEEQERLRAETFAPSGSEPVGQEKVVGRSDPVPYTPPLPVIEGTAVDLTPEEPEDDPRDVQIEPAPCGNPECFVFVGEEGRQEIHVEQCPGASS